MAQLKWEDRHTKIAEEFEKHLATEKQKVYPSYSKYIKALRDQTS